MGGKVTVIAEAGVNHNGDIGLARQLIDVAARAGADYVKFQTFKTELLVSKTAQKAKYQTVNTGNAGESQYDMVKKFELDQAMHDLLADHCKMREIKFLSTAFDLESIDLLCAMNIDFFKVPSGEITNLPYLKKIGGIGKPVVLSTGMSTLGDIEGALRVLEASGTDRKDVTVLHCNTEYPTPIDDVNLRAMTSIRDAFQVGIGYSDHTLGIEVPIAAVAMGAICIEKHFTLDRNMKGPDHRASLEPEELSQMIQSIRNIERALGTGVKLPTASESKNIPIARKSIHIARPVAKGEILREEDLVMMRPGSGISPMRMEEVIGREVRTDLPEGHLLRFNEFG